MRSKDWEGTGPEYVSGLSGLAQLAVGCARSGPEAHLNTHTCFFFYTGDISSDYHMATEARRRQRSSPAAAVTVLVLSARLAVRAISVAATWSEQCAWIAVPSPHSALLVSVLSIFPFTTRLVAVNFPTACSRQLAKPIPSPPSPPCTTPPPPPASIPELCCNIDNKTNARETQPLWLVRNCFQWRGGFLFLVGQQHCLLGGFSGSCWPGGGPLITWSGGEIGKSNAGSDTCLCPFLLDWPYVAAGARARPDYPWQAQTVALHVCGPLRARVRRAAHCPWRRRYRTNQVGDRSRAETSPTKWHSEPHGFEIIGEERQEKEKNPYIDALRTVHLVGCESFTVPACLTDNMAKGIHLKHSETTNKARSESTQEERERDDRTARDNKSFCK